ncbi:MAG: PDDEXK nuclease domain-containing protein [Bacteroidota bacterium]
MKDPYIFEFLGLPANTSISESTLEAAIIAHLQTFLMELGKGFAFVARQQHIVTDTSDFYIDLVFYNYYLKCFVLIDLKTVKLNHEAIGQMDMYVRMYDDLKRGVDDNPTIGIILCTEKDETIVKYSVLAGNEKLFASKYRLYLPDERELKALIEADRIKFELDNE